MVGIYSPNIIGAVVKFVKWYELACRTKEYTEAQLEEMDRLSEKCYHKQLYTINSVMVVELL